MINLPSGSLHHRQRIAPVIPNTSGSAHNLDIRLTRSFPIGANASRRLTGTRTVRLFLATVCKIVLRNYRRDITNRAVPRVISDGPYKSRQIQAAAAQLLCRLSCRTETRVRLTSLRAGFPASKLRQKSSAIAACVRAVCGSWRARAIRANPR
jgi:hypothetical protein